MVLHLEFTCYMFARGSSHKPANRYSTRSGIPAWPSATWHMPCVQLTHVDRVEARCQHSTSFTIKTSNKSWLRVSHAAIGMRRLSTDNGVVKPRT
jgi:hypothetical protein